MKLCVYAGSSFGDGERYRSSARDLGRVFSQRDIGLVYGGASVGLMGEVADATLEAGGTATGVLPQALADLEIAHQNLTELFVVSSMHERKLKMAELSDGFIAMPGGIGTLEELFEVWTWTQLGFHAKPVGLLNIDGFFDALITFLDHMVSERFVKPIHREMLVLSSDPDELITKLLDSEVPTEPKWIDK